MEDNGNPKLPVLQIAWDASTQNVALSFNGGPEGDFKTWDFVLGLLRMAELKAEQHMRATQMQGMMQQANDLQQATMIRRNLRGL